MEQLFLSLIHTFRSSAQFGNSKHWKMENLEQTDEQLVIDILNNIREILNLTKSDYL